MVPGTEYFRARDATPHTLECLLCIFIFQRRICEYSIPIHLTNGARKCQRMKQLGCLEVHKYLLYVVFRVLIASYLTLLEVVLHDWRCPGNQLVFFQIYEVGTYLPTYIHNDAVNLPATWVFPLVGSIHRQGESLLALPAGNM